MKLHYTLLSSTEVLENDFAQFVHLGVTSDEAGGRLRCRDGSLLSVGVGTTGRKASVVKHDIHYSISEYVHYCIPVNIYSCSNSNCCTYSKRRAIITSDCSPNWLELGLQSFEQFFEDVIARQLGLGAVASFLAGNETLEEVEHGAQSVLLQQFVAVIQRHAQREVAFDHSELRPLQTQTYLIPKFQLRTCSHSKHARTHRQVRRRTLSECIARLQHEKLGQTLRFASVKRFRVLQFVHDDSDYLKTEYMYELITRV